MQTSRRDFLGRLASTSVLIGAAPSVLYGLPSSLRVAESAHRDSSAPTAWNLKWASSLTGVHKVVVDCATIDDGGGIFRASVWAKDYIEAMGATPAQLNTVMVLRAKAIPLAFTQAFWDAYGIGAKNGVKNPITEQPTTHNPALMNSKLDKTPPEFDDIAIDRFMKRGGIVLACSVAFGEMVSMVQAHDKLTEAAATAKATKLLIPGIILQPSGVFAVVRAQQAGCHYVLGS